MATMAASSGRQSPHVSRRAGILVALTAAAGGLIAYMVMYVPVAAPIPGSHRSLLFCPLAPLPLPRGQISAHWAPAIVGALFVLAVDALTVGVVLRSRRRPEPAAAAGPSPLRVERVPLRVERVPLRVIAIAAAASLVLLVAGLMQGYRMYIPVGAAVVPWIPVIAMETVWKYEHYGFWAIFGVAVLLQLGHIGEHTVQVTQLLLYNGHLGQSHGVFGQLDFETVHFIWDSAVWLLLCVVLTKFARGNRWLWVAFIAASLHEIEHLYLFFIYLTNPWFYFHAGLAGIMGNGGLIGSPLARPYLHFSYNFLVVVPMVLAFLDQTKHVYDRAGAGGGRAWAAGRVGSAPGAVPALAGGSH
jgi:hypothetical protein